MKDKIIELFHRIALPMKDREGGAKVEEIQKYLSENGISSKYIPGKGIIANDIESPEKILMAHIDLIPLFRKGFSEEPRNVYELGMNKKGEELIIGALDNTICNAVALLAFVKLFNKGKIPNVTLFLSEGEEVGFIGAIAFLKERKDSLKNTFIINLDVTNEGWGQSGSVEYDKPNFSILRMLQKELTDCYFTNQRVCDDTDAVNDEGLFGLSFCLPTKGTIHSYKNRAKTRTLEPYFNNLCTFLLLKMPEEKEKDIPFYCFQDALDCEDEEAFRKILEERQNAIGNSGSYYYGSGQNEDYSLYDDPYAYDCFINFIYENVYENNPSMKINSIVKLSDMLFDYMASMVEFTKEDLEECIKESGVPPLLREKFGINSDTMLNKLVDFGIVEQQRKDIYQFIPQFV